ncbi:MAG: hypothetical protein KDJ78_00480 [Rhodobacteraceae bacterium]|uniref:hypothetical protein n=1 Tax=Amaricoccus sp. TaxID=1872485 RepID=UPI001D419B58|nr:hypothetical protein [Amaricoccus sp.]MCB1372655.1 hypothetical protein [Paracoccaceae bacterium]MCC0067849.1 hypothetical protein [Rhodovulum sp.]HRW15338.1 hypothetical protein [Amaricoccus sp.]
MRLAGRIEITETPSLPGGANTTAITEATTETGLSGDTITAGQDAYRNAAGRCVLADADEGTAIARARRRAKPRAHGAPAAVRSVHAAIDQHQERQICDA